MIINWRMRNLLLLLFLALYTFATAQVRFKSFRPVGKDSVEITTDTGSFIMATGEAWDTLQLVFRSSDSAWEETKQELRQLTKDAEELSQATKTLEQTGWIITYALPAALLLLVAGVVIFLVIRRR